VRPCHQYVKERAHATSAWRERVDFCNVSVPTSLILTSLLHLPCYKSLVPTSKQPEALSWHLPRQPRLCKLNWDVSDVRCRLETRASEVGGVEPECPWSQQKTRHDHQASSWVHNVVVEIPAEGSGWVGADHDSLVADYLICNSWFIIWFWLVLCCWCRSELLIFCSCWSLVGEFGCNNLDLKRCDCSWCRNVYGMLKPLFLACGSMLSSSCQILKTCHFSQLCKSLFLFLYWLSSLRKTIFVNHILPCVYRSINWMCFKM
jgi:hypothetical protein